MKKFLMLLVLAATLFACDSDDEEVFRPEISTEVQKMHITNEGGFKILAIKSNTDWTISANVDWIILSEKEGNGDKEILVAILSSDQIERTAEITLKASGANDVKITVNQDSQAVDPVVLNFAKEGGIQSFEILIDTDWELYTTADWLTLSETKGTGLAKIEVVTGAYIEEGSRLATIKVRCKEIHEVEISIEQKGLPETVGLYILSEGNWNGNQAELAYYDVKTGKLTKKYFAAQNGGAKLGDTGNDLAIYGSKMYCVVSGASVDAGGGYIEVIDPATGKSQKRIAFKDAAGKADLPRKIIFYNGKGYVTGHSGVVARLDTTSLEIDAKVKLSGTYSEGITQYHGNLYICNSGYGEGNTISVVDIATFNKESKAITVPQNPVKIQATATGDIYFTTSTLEWSTGAPSNLHVLNAKTDKVTKTFDIRVSALAIGKDYIYAVDNSTDWTTYETVDYNYKVDLKALTVASFTNSIPEMFMVYNVDVNPYNGDVYMLGQGQDVAIFGADGTLKTKLKVGTGFGNKVVPVFKY